MILLSEFIRRMKYEEYISMRKDHCRKLYRKYRFRAMRYLKWNLPSGFKICSEYARYYARNLYHWNHIYKALCNESRKTIS